MVSPDQYTALRTSAGLVDRTSRGRLMLTGQDRLTYLQGLLTNDIAALAPGTGCYAAYLTPQGRMIADMRLFEMGDALLVDLDATLAGAVADRWEMFVFSEDVQIANVSATLAQIGLYGPSSSRVLSEAFASASEAAPRGREFIGDGEPVPSDSLLAAMPVLGSTRWAFRGEPVYVLRSDDVGVMGFDLVLPSGMAEELTAELRKQGAIDVDASAAEIARVEAGRPLFGVDMNEETIPLEAGITDRAISLTKGCYVGQEIIIRVLHRGQGRVARRLSGLAFDAGAPVPAAGARVMSGEREIGAVTSAVHSPALGHAIAMAYLHRDFTEAGTHVQVKGEADAAATVTPLPFVPVAQRQALSSSADLAP